MKNKITTVLLTLAIVLGGLLFPAGSASASSPYYDNWDERIYNAAGRTIQGGFIDAVGNVAYITFASGTYEGEWPGHERWEPRTLRVAAGWCITWYWHVWGQTPGSPQTTCADPLHTVNGIRQVSIWVGQNWPGPNYDTIVTAYYPY